MSFPPPASAPVSLRHAWLGVVILYLFYVVSLMDRGVIALMVTPIKHDLDISDVQVGILQGYAFAVVYALAALPLGLAIDRWARRYLLLGAVLLWSGSTLACGLTHAFWQITLARAGVGLGEAVLIPTALSLIAELFAPARIATASAVFSSGATVGAGLSLIVGGALTADFYENGVPAILAGLTPWRAVFVVFGAGGCVLAWAALLIPDPRRTPAARTDRGTRGHFGRFLRANRAVLACLFVAFPLLNCVLIAISSWAPHHFQQSFGWNVRTAGVAVGVLTSLVEALGIVCGGAAMDKVARSGLTVPYFVIPIASTAVGGPLVALAFLQTKPWVAGALIIPGLFVFSAYGSAQYVVLQLLAPASLRGRLAALYVVALSLIGTGLGTLLPPLVNRLSGSQAANLGPATALVIFAASATCIAILAWGRTWLREALAQARSPPLAGG